MTMYARHKHPHMRLTSPQQSGEDEGSDAERDQAAADADADGGKPKKQRGGGGRAKKAAAAAPKKVKKSASKKELKVSTSPVVCPLPPLIFASFPQKAVLAEYAATLDADSIWMRVREQLLLEWLPEGCPVDVGRKVCFALVRRVVVSSLPLCAALRSLG